VPDKNTINRRTFLSSSLLSAVAGVAIIGGRPLKAEPLPVYMRTMGRMDEEYGQPSIYEKDVKRKAAAPYESSIFTITHTPLDQLRGTLTPSGLHFSVQHNGIPDIQKSEHVLKLHGLVKKPLKWNYESLSRYPMITVTKFIECSGNSAANAVSKEPVQGNLTDLCGEVSNTEWVGVPLSYLLDEAGVKPEGKWVVCEGADGGSHIRSIPLEKLYDDAIIALYQNGEALRPSQGYPMRLLLPGWEGNANVKWLHRLEVVKEPSQSKDEASLYAEFTKDDKLRQFTFLMKVKSIITTPSSGHILPGKGFYEISGLAWSGAGKIKMVEVSVDGGKTWSKAKLQEPVLSKAFCRFSLPWNYEGKETILISRATDEFGNIQPTRDEWKSRYASYTFNHYNAIQAWKITKDAEVKNVYI